MSFADVDFPSDLRSLESEYELVRELGQGGMAAVYLARHRASDRVVAIKAIRARYLDDPDAIKRFAREARTVAGLDHPNIVRTEAIRQIDDRAVAIIMEHIPGGTVRDRLREFGSLGAEDAEWILRDVANALGYAHRQGIVHRDVKPENIFLDATRRRALLSDFGIARTIDTESGITLLGAALGTPQYMSPEQIDGDSVDGRSDIYSLGVLGWELLTGRRPWAGESLYGVIYKQKHEDLARITSLRPRVPANLLFAIEGALVKDKTRRWQSIDEFLDHLTYNPPPLLSQTYSPGGTAGEYAATVQFRAATLRGDEPADAEQVIDVDTKLREEAATLFAPDPALALPARDAVERGASITPPSASDAIDAAPFPGSEYTLPEYDPNAEPPYDPARRRRIAQIVGLTIPLGVAAASLFAMLGSSTGQSTTRTSMEVTASARTVAADSALSPRSISTVLTSAPPTGPDSAAVRVPADLRAGDIMTARKSGVAKRPAAKASQPAGRTSGNTRARVGQAGKSSQARDGQAARGESVRAGGHPADDSAQASARRAGTAGETRDSTLPLEDPFRPPEPPPPLPKALGKGEVPTPQCRVAAADDQQACLDAYIAIADAHLNRALGTLVEELRRVSHTPLGVADPPTVQRVRVEQQAWIAARENECPRSAPAGAGPLWGQSAASCFTSMSSARTAELRDAIKRLKRKR
ncbi:MAG TPA: protein kinase [Gemmatimonadaceae bacterium]|nr:protein kinase [Gemmatimonadaceae bacterium]